MTDGADGADGTGTDGANGTDGTVTPWTDGTDGTGTDGTDGTSGAVTDGTDGTSGAVTNSTDSADGTGTDGTDAVTDGANGADSAGADGADGADGTGADSADGISSTGSDFSPELPASLQDMVGYQGMERDANRHQAPHEAVDEELGLLRTAHRSLEGMERGAEVGVEVVARRRICVPRKRASDDLDHSAMARLPVSLGLLIVKGSLPVGVAELRRVEGVGRRRCHHNAAKLLSQLDVACLVGRVLCLASSDPLEHQPPRVRHPATVVVPRDVGWAPVRVAEVRECGHPDFGERTAAVVRRGVWPVGGRVLEYLWWAFQQAGKPTLLRHVEELDVAVIGRPPAAAPREVGSRRSAVCRRGLSRVLDVRVRTCRKRAKAPPCSPHS